MVERVEKIEKIQVYKSSRTGQLFETYEEAYNCDCRDFVESLEGLNWLNFDLLNEQCAIEIFKLNNREELEMFVDGFSDIHRPSWDDSLKNFASEISEFPCVLYCVGEDGDMYTETQLIAIFNKAIEKILKTSEKVKNDDRGIQGRL